MGKSWVRSFLRPPPPQDRVKPFFAPPFTGWKHFAPLPPPPSVWLKLQAPALKLPQHFLCPLFSMAKSFPAPPFLKGSNFTCPSLPFCSPPPPPLPVISDQSLMKPFFPTLEPYCPCSNQALTQFSSLSVPNSPLYLAWPCMIMSRTAWLLEPGAGKGGTRRGTCPRGRSPCLHVISKPTLGQSSGTDEQKASPRAAHG